MSKRFTDPQKWRNPWFRSLPLKAKLVWSFLCDECDFAGIWKADYELASFQLGFSISQPLLIEWFGEKISVFDKSKVLIVPFYEFQYSLSKDSWTAKVKARERLCSIGFEVIDGKVIVPSLTTVPPQSQDSPPSVLIEGVVVSVVKEGGLGEKSDYPDYFETVWKIYRKDSDKKYALEIYDKNVKPTEHSRVYLAVETYNQQLDRERTGLSYVKNFSTFLSKRRWISWAEKGEAAAIKKTKMPQYKPQPEISFHDSSPEDLAEVRRKLKEILPGYKAEEGA